MEPISMTLAVAKIALAAKKALIAKKALVATHGMATSAHSLSALTHQIGNIAAAHHATGLHQAMHGISQVSGTIGNEVGKEALRQTADWIINNKT